MGPRPWKPDVELDGALERGDLEYAITLAVDVSTQGPKPIDLDTALRFLPLVIGQRLGEYDGWALRWLGRWVRETPGATIEQAAEIAGMLADLPTEPGTLQPIRESLASSRAR
jgi:hypothetical protein